MALDAITDTNFDTEVLKETDKDLVLVKFWAPWCRPCLLTSALLDELKPDYQDKIKFVQLNTDENPTTCSIYKVSGVPTLLLFNKGELVDQLASLGSRAQIRNTFDKHLARIAEA